MSSKKPLVATTDIIVKEGINDMETKYDVAREAITHIISKNKIGAINKKDKPQVSQSKIYKSIRN